MTKYARTVGGNWNTDATWSSTSGGTADTVQPTAADDVKLDGNSGNVTINGTPVCRSLDCTGYTGTLTHTAAITLTIGDGTAGLSNIALKLVAGMTYTLGHSSTAALSFVSTSTTQQTIDFGGKQTGAVTFNGASGSWLFSSDHTMSGTGALTLTAGTLNTNGYTCSWGSLASSNSNTRVLTLGASNITITAANATVWSFQTVTGSTINAGTSVITLTGANSNFIGGTGRTYYTVNLNGSGTSVLDASSTFTNLARNGTASKTDRLDITAATTTVTGTLTLAGNSATNRLIVQSTTVGTQKTFAITGATMVWSNVDFQDITLSGGTYDASAITGLSGDCGGNSNITFTTASAQTWQGTSGGNWSDNTKWTSRVPLPQDDVTINNAFSASQTVTADMPRLGKSIDFTGVSGSVLFSLTTTTSIYGSLTFSSGMTLGTAAELSLSGRGNFTLTSSGQAFGTGLNINAFGGKYTLQDAASTFPGILTLTRGQLDSNGYAVTAVTFVSNNTNTRTLTMGSSYWTITTSPTAWAVNYTNLTVSAANATIEFTATNANAITFNGGGQTWGTITRTAAGASRGTFTIQGNNTISTLNVSNASAATTLIFSSGSNNAITTFNVFGTSGKVLTLVGSSVGSTFTLTFPATTISTDYMFIRDSIATGGGSYYAGANSTDGLNNTGWIFTDPPAGGGTAVNLPLLFVG